MHPVRISLIFLLIVGAAAVIVSRLFFLQVTKHDFYSALARGQQQVFEDIPPERGDIYLMDKKSVPVPLAVNRDYPYVYAVPKDIEDVEAVAQTLADILGSPKDEIYVKISKQDDPFERIADRLSDEQAQRIREVNMKGVSLRTERLRYYPYGETACHVSGFLGQSEDGLVGRYGLEDFYEENLRGVPGKISGEKDARGTILKSFGELEDAARPGDDLYLTIDPNVQSVVEDALKAGVEKWGADGGSIIVTDPVTGAIRAMASWPRFDLNNYSKVEDANVYANPVVSHVFEPGSVFKPITIAAGIDTKAITPLSTYENTGSVQIGSYTITNVVQEAKGTRTMTEVLEESLNTGVIHVEEKMGGENLTKYIKSFGFQEKTGVDLFGETVGNIANLEEKRPINYATASFGQGISVTPLAMVNAIGVIANGGNLMRPYVVQTVQKPDGEEVRTEPKVIRRVISQKTATDVSAMMVAVVRNGTGKRAQIPGYTIAGKTGTAEVPNPDRPGYSDKDIHSFAGFFPAFNPKALIFVKLDDPKGVRYAEGSVVPMFKDIAQYLITYYSIAPDIDGTK